MVGAAPLRVVFFGTPEFAVPTLTALIESRHPVVGVVTQPDRPCSRGQHVLPSPVKTLAMQHGIPLLQPLKMRDDGFLDALREWAPDLGVVAAYGRILTDAILEIPRLGMINVHASLLPRWRGAAPIHRAIMAGDRETGVTIMRVVRELDAGPMLDVARRPIGEDETSVDVERALAVLGAERLVAVVDRLAEGPVPEEPQPEAGITYAERITREDSPIDWRRPARALHDQIRGLHPWPLASTTFEGRRLIVTRSAVVDDEAERDSGTVVESGGDRLVVATGRGLLRLLEIKPEGRRAMSAREFLAGHRIPAGARFE